MNDWSMPVVDVVIPTIGRWDLLGQAIDAVQAQVGVGTRIIVVNDSGKPAPVSIAQRADVVDTAGRTGEGAARAAGLAAVTSDLVAFCDDDDLWRPHKLARQVEALGSTRGWCIAAAGRADLQGRRRRGWDLGRAIELMGRRDFSRLVLMQNPVPAGASVVLVDTNLLRSVGGWDSALGYFADWDCWIRLSEVVEPILIDEELATYRLWPGQMINDRSAAWDALDYIRAKHADRRELLGIGPLHDWSIAWILAGELQTPGRRMRGLAEAAKRLVPRRPRHLLGVGPLFQEMFYGLGSSAFASRPTRAAQPRGFSYLWAATSMGPSGPSAE